MASEPVQDERVVVAERKSSVSDRVARLVRIRGKLMCECPYLCDATSEKCEFAGQGYE